jgi:hypothetical protein
LAGNQARRCNYVFYVSDFKTEAANKSPMVLLLQSHWLRGAREQGVSLSTYFHESKYN